MSEAEAQHKNTLNYFSLHYIEPTTARTSSEKQRQTNNKNGIAVATHCRHRKSLTLENQPANCELKTISDYFLANINFFRFFPLRSLLRLVLSARVSVCARV